MTRPRRSAVLVVLALIGPTVLGFVILAVLTSSANPFPAMPRATSSPSATASPRSSSTVTPSRPSRVSVTREASRSRPARPPETATGGTGSGTGSLDWRALAECESSNDPQAVSSSGKYRGLYQFDLTTWRSVGGTGDPASASPAEQTHRARLLYAQRGRAPWPLCGSHL